MLRSLISSLTDIIYPKTCAICKEKLKPSAIHGVVCEGCWQKRKVNLPPFCHSCGRRLEKKNINKSFCPGCLKKRLNFDRAFSPYAYDGVIKELIHQFKYKNKDYLSPFLGKMLTDFIKEYNIAMRYIDFIVPIPLHQSKLREREFNQAELLGKAIAAEFGRCLRNDILFREKATRAQAELEAGERFLNVEGSFSTKKHEELKGKNLLLVDDVLTTGATSSEAASALKEAGANIVFVLTLAN